MSASAADRTCEYGDADQCPNDRNPIFFTPAIVGTGRLRARPNARPTRPDQARTADRRNHEQMGWYTGQPNDPPATISREEEQQQVGAATLDLLAQLP